MQISHSSTGQQRLLRPDDLKKGVELSSAAGWNQTAEDWEMLMDLTPDGCFALEADGQLVSTTTLLCYQRRLAWIGMVLTRAKYRGRGFAPACCCAATRRFAGNRNHQAGRNRSGTSTLRSLWVPSRTTNRTLVAAGFYGIANNFRSPTASQTCTRLRL